MDNFDDLSNEQLRLKLLEYGLANMPVTQTTRKVLIKKLKNHLENANSKVRRETIHIAKYSSDEDDSTGDQKKSQKKETSRRATIAGSAAKLSKTLPVLPDLPAPKAAANKPEKPEPAQKRRSGRITPLPDKEAGSTRTAPTEPMITENSDEDDDLIPLTQLSRRDRKSKSPSLTRGEMVSTSYIHEVEVAAKPPIIEEMEIDLTESTDDVVVEPPEPVQKTRPPVTPSRETRFTSNITTSTNKRTTISATPGLSQHRQTEFNSSFGRPSISATTTYSYSSPQPVKRDDLKLEPSDSPYLSEFTKRLSRLKAESAQLNAVGDHPIRRTIASSYSASPRPNYMDRRLTSVHGRDAANGKGEIRASLRQVILALDQKYSLKNLFYALIVLLVAIFLFVFFFL